jgi:hypothetical protein
MRRPWRSSVGDDIKDLPRMQIVLYMVKPFAPTNFERQAEIGAPQTRRANSFVQGFPWLEMPSA